MTAHIVQANTLHLPLADGSVDLICTSPPYWSLRSYTDQGGHYNGQIGDEPTAGQYLDHLIAATREWMRVLKPTGSIWINLGDKYVADNRGSGTDHKRGAAKHAPRGDAGFVGRETARQKSLIGLPWRYALRCIDDLGLILRRDLIWAKPNGLPESVTDRCRSSHEYWFHLVKQPNYYAAIDRIRQQYDGERKLSRRIKQPGNGKHDQRAAWLDENPLGALPGSVWTIPTEPLNIPEHVQHTLCCDGRPRSGCEDGVSHYAAFPTAWPRQIIQGWSPADVCRACGEGRRPTTASVGLNMDRPQARRAHELAEQAGLTEDHLAALLSVGVSDTGRGAATQNGTGKNTAEVYALANEARTALGGYSREYLLRRPTSFRDVCGCPDTSAPTTPGVVLDPFGGTGTTALLADVLGRTGITADMSYDYSTVITRWRLSDPGERARAMQVPKPAAQIPDQGDLFADLTERGA